MHETGREIGDRFFVVVGKECRGGFDANPSVKSQLIYSSSKIPEIKY